MTTLELFKKHRKGEVSRERFLYEVRRDNNLPWITNVTSYTDAVKILKNKGIIREAYENVATDPAVDRVNPYYLKKGVMKDLDKDPDLKDDSYIKALNKNAKKLVSDPKAFHGEMFGNYDTVQKADAKLQMTPVKKDNFVDEANGMKKVKGQETPKAMSAPTKENRKGKPKDVKVMPDKGVEGSEKVIKEISSYLKKKLTESNPYHDFHEGMQVETAHGTGIVKEVNGGTLTVETQDGKLHDVQMNHAKHFAEKKKSEQFGDKADKFEAKKLGYEDGSKLANKLVDAIEVYNSLSDEQKEAEAEKLGVDVLAKLKAAHDDIMNRIHDESNYPQQVEDDLQENQYSLRAGRKPYHDPTSQLTGTGKPNVTGPMPTDDLDDETELQPGDRVKVVYGNQFYGMTGTIEDVKGGFVIVNIDEDGEDYSMHSSDVEKIGEEDDLYEARDFNDPALVASRARIEKYRTTPKQSLANYLDDKDRDFEILQQIKALKREKFQVMRDMEQEAEPEGGPIADDYADRLMDLDQQIKALESQLYEQELDEESFAGKDSIVAFKKSPKYSALSGPTRVEMEKKLAAGGSVEL